MDYLFKTRCAFAGFIVALILFAALRRLRGQRVSRCQEVS